MIVGVCTVYLSIEQANTLKEKRMVLKSLIARLKNKFNISVAEVDNQDIIKNATIGFACVTNDTGHANSIIQHVLNYIETFSEAVIIDISIEIL